LGGSGQSHQAGERLKSPLRNPISSGVRQGRPFFTVLAAADAFAFARRDQKGILTRASHFGQSSSRPSRRPSTTSLVLQPRHRKTISMLNISGGYTGTQTDCPGIAGKPGIGTDRSHRVQSITSPAWVASAVSAWPQTAQKNEMDDIWGWKRFSQAIKILDLLLTLHAYEPY
jgi:hypothetical protein